MLTWKVRITVLWIFIAVCQSAVTILELFEPGVIRDIMSGKLPSAGVDIWLASSWILPMAMAYLTLILKDAPSRWTNALIGAGYVLISVSTLVSLLAGSFGAGVRFVVLTASLVSLLIVWHAWKWPRPSELTQPQQRRETTLR